jgi:hypothetical protein
MPPLPHVPNVVKLVVRGTYHDTAWINVFHVEYGGGRPTSGNLATFLAGVDIAVGTYWPAEMSVDNEVVGYDVVDLTDDLGASATLSVSHFGSRTGDFNPANVAVCMSHKINRRYRGGHPRTYLSWGTSGTFASGSTKDWDPAFLASVNSNYGAFESSISSITAGSTTFNQSVNVSYRNAGSVRATAVVDPIVGHTAAARVCSQRRRLGKVGG